MYKKMTQEEQIIDCENRLLEAMKTSDVTALDELLHERLIFNIPTGQTITKAMDIENYRLGRMRVHEISATEQVVEVFENTAAVASTVHLKAKYMGMTVDGRFRYLRVWKLTDDLWRIIAGSGSQIH
jgi:hypothetical protein